MTTPKIAVFSLIALWTIGAGNARIGAGQAALPRSVWDGVYTDEQAKRGELKYDAVCASCHGPTLLGDDVALAPALVGGEFGAKWNGLSLGDLFERIRTSMPQNDPGSLSRQQIADILAFILRAGQFPAGETELPHETEPLKQIRFEATKP